MGDDVYTGKNGKKTAPTTHLIIKWPKNVFNGLKTADFACGEPFFYAIFYYSRGRNYWGGGEITPAE